MIGILLISTRKYKQFVAPLITQIDEFFLPDYPKIIFLFTDEYQKMLRSKNEIRQIIIPSYGWPYATLFRYKIFSDNANALSECSHLFYLDVDYAIVDTVTDEILTDGLIAVRHPGFFVNDGWGDSSNPLKSTSYLPIDKRKHYYCGGTQGGRSDYYLAMASELSNNIEVDIANSVKGEHNDETHYNKFMSLNETIPVTEFGPRLCMVEQESLRAQWGISNIKPAIIALAKNHSEIRS